MNGLQDILKIHWLERWAGSYTFISCSYWGEQYFSSLKRELGVQFDRTLFIHTKGTVSFFIPQEEYEAFGKTLAAEVVRDPELAKKRLGILKSNTDSITAVMKKLTNRIPTEKEYTEFLVYLDRHLPYHNFMKKTVDFLPEESAVLLDFFRDARTYSEHVYSDTEKFFRDVMQAVAVKEQRNPDTLTCLTKQDFEEYLKNGTLPDEKTLEDRFNKSALYFEMGEQAVFLSENAEAVERGIYTDVKDISEVRGVGVFPGTIQGRARVIRDPHNPGKFQQGDILVTGMTRPEFMPLIKKAGAIVTDVGGVLCHAAITARELKIPCVVGAKVATKMLKDNDLIEVDAKRGIIRKL